MATSGGFLLTEDGVWEVTTDPTGATWQTGFLRGPIPPGEHLGPLVVTTDPTGAKPSGYLRSPDGALVVEEGVGVYGSGLAKTVSGALAVTSGIPGFGQRQVNGLAPPTEAPVNVTPPVVSTDGSPETGEQVSVSRGSWQNSPSGYAYQWKRGGANIAGATNQTYVLDVADEGQNLTVTVTATNVIGSTPADSNTIVPQAPAPEGPFPLEALTSLDATTSLVAGGVA